MPRRRWGFCTPLGSKSAFRRIDQIWRAEQQRASRSSAETLNRHPPMEQPLNLQAHVKH